MYTQSFHLCTGAAELTALAGQAGRHLSFALQNALPGAFCPCALAGIYALLQHVLALHPRRYPAPALTCCAAVLAQASTAMQRHQLA
jgi:hypothetical protein